MQAGIDKLADAVGLTLGPRGNFFFPIISSLFIVSLNNLIIYVLLF